MRRDYVEPVTEIHKQVQEDAILSKEHDGLTAYVSAPQAFVKVAPLRGQRVGYVHSHEEHSLRLHLSDAPTFTDEPVELIRDATLFDAPDLFHQLTTYRQQFWTVCDSDSEVPDDFQQFMTNVQQVPAFDVNVRSPGLWVRAIESQKAYAARGIDGASGAELKQLPGPAITQLAQIMADMSVFPPWFGSW